jgi:signal transduction histidine kinase
MSGKTVLEDDGRQSDTDVIQTGAFAIHRRSPARVVAHEQAALSLLEEIANLLQSDEPDEGEVLREFVGILNDVGLQCALDVEQHDGSRVRYSVGTRGARLDGLIDRQVERAILEGHAIWCSREPISQPFGVVRARPRDVWSLRELGALSLEWILCVSIGDTQRTLGALTVYATLDESELVSIALVRNIAQLVGIALANRRHHAAMMAAVERRDIAMATVAHDLKNPLSVILMTSRLVRAGLEMPPASADTIERHATYMLLLVHDILEAAVMSSTQFVIHPSPCSARSLVGEALASVEPLASQKALRLEIDVAKNVSQVLVDPHRIMQVLLNLLGNAVKFTPREGSIVVGAHPHDEGVAFSVLDSGPGLSRDQADHVFERFWRAESSNTGTGLGLTIARDIVEAHGGRIWVESEENQGAKFVFTVPCAPPKRTS